MIHYESPNISLNEQTFLNRSISAIRPQNKYLPLSAGMFSSPSGGKKFTASEAAQQTTTTNMKIISNEHISYHCDDFGLKIFVSEPASILEGK